MKLVIVLIVVLISGSLTAQEDIKAFFTKVNSTYLESDFDITYTALAYSQPGLGEELGKGRIARINHGYYVQFGMSEIVYSEKGILSIDHYSKSVRYTKTTNKQKPTEVNQLDFLSQINLADTVFLLSSNKGINEYRFSYKNNVVKSVDIIINQHSYFIESMVYHYQPMDDDTESDFYQLELNYAKHEVNTSNNKLTDFNEYLSKSKEGFIYLPDSAYQVNVIN